ncbi:protein FAM110A-like isoform X2 [Corythoichthys intestinalis]|uniref:protein FAM110A-like isoform X2 n=1 Tax=Corythoichthys intestinalis TaxID=161448 RepID=UPI0025A5DC7E|nr:protein FAM110A-like isoform X2 [Corythoichthys intestinalis]XP_061803023.1 protein FAM110A-like [Nerophis lumbriciformis]
MPAEGVRRPVGGTFPRVKGPISRRQSPPGDGRSKQSAVERLEADKAKYVKSQAALSKRRPLSPLDVRKCPLNVPLAAALKRTPVRSEREAVQLDLRHLSSLISDVGDGAESAPRKTDTSDTPPSRPAKVGAKSERPDGPGSPTSGTVRRVDVIPQAGARIPHRPPPFICRPFGAPPLLRPLRPAISQLLLLYAKGPPSPLKAAPSAPERPPFLAPPSPDAARLSGSPRRSLSRSKSDTSERFSRAGTELERFFDLCGLDAADVQELAGSASDALSLGRFRSVSAPGTECAASGDEEAEERVPDAVSVIERNARVIKWLYGLHQQK